jgi:DtxR family transcriptional regulator, Mn-dependent transcriptional regulator
VSGGLIDSTEMYLRTVLELEEEGIPALRARLAERLELSAPSVSEGVARLESDGLVRLEEDRTVSLTDAGRQVATHVMRKHRLAERLLVDVLGVEPEHVHEEACRWEHVISDRVEQKLVEFLGNPTTSPYGNPIPGTTNPDYELVALADTTADRVRIERISEQLQGNHDVMGAFDAAGVWAGDEVSVERTDGRVALRVDGKPPVALDGDDARLLFVTEL